MHYNTSMFVVDGDGLYAGRNEKKVCRQIVILSLASNMAEPENRY